MKFSFFPYKLPFTALNGPKGRSFRLPFFTAALLSIAFVFAIIQGARAQDELVGLTSNGGPQGRGTAFSIKSDGTAFSIVRGFADWGATLSGNLIRGADGNFYGMAYEGGTYNTGTVFKVTSAGAVTVLKQLNLSVDGGYPRGSLLLAKDGNFYGLLSSGSVNNGGAIFKLTTAGVFTIVRSLSINTDGGRPQGKLIQATDGNFYGINNSGGANGYGNIFKITPDGVYTVLKSFNKSVDGGTSYGSLLQASDGNLYGMAQSGGASNYGVIFRLTLSGTYTVLRSFNGAGDGGNPYSDLIQAKDGFLYGMTSYGGTNYNGTIFKINTSGTTFTVLKALNTSVDGGNPEGNLIQGTDGNFYGLTRYTSGGTNGSFFKMTSAGVLTVLKKFSLATTGGYPLEGLIQSTDGNFYGTTSQGGNNMYGTIFKITPSGTLTVLSSFNGATEGNDPEDNPLVAKDSAYYGMTQLGGTFNYGTIFKICAGTTTVLHSFNKSTEGGNPVGALVQATDGNFYGVTYTGGTNGAGTIFRMAASGTYTVLKHLSATTDGSNPKGNLVQGPDGALYGMTTAGGTSSVGTIFKITTAGVFTVLRHLVPSTDGGNPEGSLTVGKDGVLYGLTSSNSRFFKITTAGAFTVIKTLTYSTEGSNFPGALIIGTDGNFYGANSTGGPNGGGNIFKITTTGTLTILRSLTPATDGSAPKGNLVQASDGNFYGVTSQGGTNKLGTIFRITAAKTFTVLRHFSMATDGGSPQGGLAIAPKNNIVATPQTNLATNEDVAKTVTLAGTGSPSLKYVIVTSPKNGTVTSGTAASRTYTPKLNYSGKDSFAFSVTAGCLISKPVFVTFTIAQVNDTPVLASIGNKNTPAGTKLTFTATASDVDAGQTKSFSLIGAPSGATINATSGVFTWTPATAGSYTFKVRVTDNGSPAKYDEEQITITVSAAKIPGSITTREEILEGLIVKVYPNPVKDKVTITLPLRSGPVGLTIVNLQGVLISTSQYLINGDGRVQINTSSLAPGSYFLHLKTSLGRKTVKLIKY